MAIPAWKAFSGKWCPGAELNHRHCDFQSHALPTELPGRCWAWARERRFIVRLACPVYPACNMPKTVEMRPIPHLSDRLEVIAWNSIAPAQADPAPRPRFRHQLSTLILASRMTGPHLSISDFRKAASSAGVEPFGVAPSSSNRDLTGAWASAALVSALILAMTSCGVLAGTKKPNHENTSKPGKPDSAMVGRSGTTATRSLVVTASPRKLPAFTCSSTVGMLSKMTSTRPGIRSLIAGAPPRYGMCVIATFAIRLNNSPHRCSVVPLPEDA